MPINFAPSKGQSWWALLDRSENRFVKFRSVVFFDDMGQRDLILFRIYCSSRKQVSLQTLPKIIKSKLLNS